MSLLDHDQSPKYKAPVTPAWETAFDALPDDIRSEIMVNATVLHRSLKSGPHQVSFSEHMALEVMARLYALAAGKRKAVTR